MGDRVSVKLSGQEYGFVVRGVVYSPEFICVTDGVYPNPDQYGYILINTCGMPDLPMTQVLVKLADGVDAQQAEKAITDALPAALVVNRARIRVRPTPRAMPICSPISRWFSC